MCITGTRTTYSGCRCANYEINSDQKSEFCILGKFCAQLGGHANLRHARKPDACRKCKSRSAGGQVMIGRPAQVPRVRAPASGEEMESVLREIEEQITQQLQRTDMTLGRTIGFLHFILSHPAWTTQRAVAAFGREAGKYFKKRACDRMVQLAGRKGQGPLLEDVITRSRDETAKSWRKYREQQKSQKKE